MKKVKIQDFRKKKGLTQNKAAEMLKITKEYLSMIERGIRNPSDNLKKKMAILYQVSIADIFLALQETKCCTKGRLI